MKIWEDGQIITANDINLILQRLPLSRFYWGARKMTSEKIQEKTQLLNNLFPSANGEDITTYTIPNKKIYFYKIDNTIQDIFNSFQVARRPVNWNTCLVIEQFSNNKINYKYNSSFLLNSLYGLTDPNDITNRQAYIKPYMDDGSENRNSYFFNGCNLYIMSVFDSYHYSNIQGVLKYPWFPMRTTGLNDQIYYIEVKEQEQQQQTPE